MRPTMRPGTMRTGGMTMTITGADGTMIDDIDWNQ
jgi:hypothetical protein